MTDEVLATELPEPTPTPEPVAAPVAAQEAPAPTMEDTIRETYRELTGEPAQPLRGPDGKFARAESAEPAAEVPTEGLEAPAAEPKPWDAAPNTWRKETAQKWAALDPEIRQEIHRRESDFHKGIGEYRDAAAFGRSIFEDVSPHFDVMRQIGGTPREVLREVMGAWRALATGTPEQKQSTLLRLAEGYGISLGELADARDRAPSANPELAPVLQRMERIESSLTQAQRAQAEAAWQGQVEQAQKFLSDPSREYMADVVDDVIGFVKAGYTPEDAYNKAIWAHPGTRDKLLAKEAQERQKREAAEAAKARRAAAANVTRRGTPPAAPAKGSMDDTIRAEWRRLNGG